MQRRGAAIDIKGLRRDYGSGDTRVVALDDIDLNVKPGEFVCLVGPSGCGKSTLLRILAGLDTQTGGTIKVEAAGFAVENAMVFQESGFLSLDERREERRLRPDDARRAGRRDRAARRGRVEARRPDQIPSSLSAPAVRRMRQRGAIARAFVTDPAMLLMDEPFAALDAQNRAILQAELTRIWEETGKTVVYVTHSIEEALLLGDRCVLMTAQPGRIKRIIDIPFAHPRDVIALGASAQFGALKLDIWHVLEEEVNRARAEMEQ